MAVGLKIQSLMEDKMEGGWQEKYPKTNKYINTEIWQRMILKKKGSVKCAVQK